MTLEGEITLTRTLLASELWAMLDADAKVAFIELLLLANNRSGVAFIRGRPREMRAGQVGWSIKGLGSRWGWNFRKTKGFLEMLRDRGTIEFTEDGEEGCIRFKNYEFYNRPRTAGAPPEHRPRTAGAPPEQTEREREREQEPPMAAAGDEVPTEAEVLTEAGAYPGNLAIGAPAGIPERWAKDWLHSRTSPGRARLVQWRVTMCRDFERDFKDRVPKAVPQKNGAKNGGAVSASVEVIRLQKELEDLRGEMETVYNTEGPSAVDYRRIKAEALEIERRLAQLRGGGE